MWPLRVLECLKPFLAHKLLAFYWSSDKLSTASDGASSIVFPGYSPVNQSSVLQLIWYLMKWRNAAETCRPFLLHPEWILPESSSLFADYYNFLLRYTKNHLDKKLFDALLQYITQKIDTGVVVTSPPAIARGASGGSASELMSIRRVHHWSVDLFAADIEMPSLLPVALSAVSRLHPEVRANALKNLNMMVLRTAKQCDMILNSAPNWQTVLFLNLGDVVLPDQDADAGDDHHMREIVNYVMNFFAVVLDHVLVCWSDMHIVLRETLCALVQYAAWNKRTAHATRLLLSTLLLYTARGCAQIRKNPQSSAWRNCFRLLAVVFEFILFTHATEEPLEADSSERARFFLPPRTTSHRSFNRSSDAAGNAEALTAAFQLLQMLQTSSADASSSAPSGPIWNTTLEGTVSIRVDAQGSCARRMGIRFVL
jgi:hypothetical protein